MFFYQSENDENGGKIAPKVVNLRCCQIISQLFSALPLFLPDLLTIHPGPQGNALEEMRKLVTYLSHHAGVPLPVLPGGAPPGLPHPLPLSLHSPGRGNIS